MMSNKVAASDGMCTASDQPCTSFRPQGNYTAAH